MEGFIPGRKSCSTSLVMLVLCLCSILLTVVTSSELPFLQPLHHGAISESTQKQGTQHHHWLRMFSRDHLPWSPGSQTMDHHHHRVVHEYQPRPMTPNCEMRRIRPGHGVNPGHRFHLRGTPPASNFPVNGIVHFHFRGTTSTAMSLPENGKPTPPGGSTPPPNPSADVIVEVVPPRLAPVNGIVDKPTPRGYPPPPTNPGANVIVEVVNPPIAVVRASRQYTSAVLIPTGAE